MCCECDLPTQGGVWKYERRCCVSGGPHSPISQPLGKVRRWAGKQPLLQWRRGLGNRLDADHLKHRARINQPAPCSRHSHKLGDLHGLNAGLVRPLIDRKSPPLCSSLALSSLMLGRAAPQRRTLRSCFGIRARLYVAPPTLLCFEKARLASLEWGTRHAKAATILHQREAGWGVSR